MSEIPITQILTQQGDFNKNVLFCVGATQKNNIPIVVGFDQSRVSYSIVTGNNSMQMVELLRKQTEPNIRGNYGLPQLQVGSRVEFSEFDFKLFQELKSNIATPGLIHRIFYINGILDKAVKAGEIRTNGSQIATLQNGIAEVGIRVALK